MTACIYGLVDPRDNRVFYIGQTKKGHKTRLREHIRDCKRSHTHKNHKISQLIENNLTPQILILEWVYNNDILNEREKYCIKYYNKFYKLTNVKNGGYGKTNAGNYKGENVYLSKLSEKDVLEIIDLYKNTNMTAKEISEFYNVGRGGVERVVSGKSWKHITSGKIKSNYSKKRPLVGVKNPMAKLNEHDIQSILEMRKRGMTLLEISNKSNVGMANIGLICSGQSWKNISENVGVNCNNKPNKHAAKLNKEKVIEIRQLLKTHTQKEISKLYGVSQTSIFRIKHNITWGDV